MWLLKNERRLLRGYYLKIGKVEKEKWYQTTNWIPVMKSVRVKRNAINVKEYLGGSGNNYTGGNNVHQYNEDVQRLNEANDTLVHKGLIRIRPHQSETDVAAITLTQIGYELGQKYNSPWKRFRLWFTKSEGFISTICRWLLNLVMPRYMTNMKTMFTIVVISLVAVTSYYVSVVNQKTKSIYAAIESHPQKGDVNALSAVNVPIKSEAIRPQRTAPQYTPTTIPDSIIDEQLLQHKNTFISQWDQIENSGLPVSNRRQMLLQLQNSYTARKQQMLASKQQLAVIRQLHSQGTLDDVATERAMWRVIGLPQDTVENISVPKSVPEPTPALPDAHGVVTGILLSEKTPMAVIDGKVVGVDQSIYGVKVVKIQDGYVEFDKSGVRWSQRINESPSTSWPGR
jgi:hypothetical protein